MLRRVFVIISLLLLGVLTADASQIKWVDFDIPYESLKYAMDIDIATFEQEKHIDWVDVLALAATRTGGKCNLEATQNACKDMQKDLSARELAGSAEKTFDYYEEVYRGVLGGLLGNYAIEVDGEMRATYGLKAFSPIAAGYGYSHCSDFGNSRSFGFARRHLGNDLMGSLGTPIVAVESGVVEALGWNRYGGWRIGIRSADSKRYYYYAHLQKDQPFAPGLALGDVVQAGDLIGFMGRTGYSDKENTNNIETVHLHFGMELVFDEAQKECNNEIWINVYNLVRLLHAHRSSLRRTNGFFERVYPFVDLDIPELAKIQKIV